MKYGFVSKKRFRVTVPDLNLSGVVFTRTGGEVGFRFIVNRYNNFYVTSINSTTLVRRGEEVFPDP